MKHIYILVGPSGAGKDYLLGRALTTHPGLYSIPSYTTRPPRTKQAAHPFHYVTQAEFDDAWSAGKILERVVEHGHCYGTDKEALDGALARGKTAITVVEPRGVESFKKIYGKDVISIFIDPGSVDALEHRIRIDPRRKGQTDKEIALRIERAKKEMTYIHSADHIVRNADGEQDNALRQLESIIFSRSSTA